MASSQVAGIFDERYPRLLSRHSRESGNPLPVQAGVHEAWLVIVPRDYADRVLPVDAEAAKERERTNVPDPIPIVDGLMASTAKVRNTTLVTRNTAYVTRTGLRLLYPFDASE